MREYARAIVAVVTRRAHKATTKRAPPLLFEWLSRFEVSPSGAGQEGPLKYAWVAGGILMAHWDGGERVAVFRENKPWEEKETKRKRRWWGSRTLVGESCVPQREEHNSGKCGPWDFTCADCK